MAPKAKRNAAKKAAAFNSAFNPPPPPPLESLEEFPSAVEIVTTHENPVSSGSHSGELMSRPRSKSQGAAALAAQILSEPAAENHTAFPSRRRASTRASESAMAPPPASVFQFLEKDSETAPDSESLAKLKRSTKAPMKEKKRKPAREPSFNSDSGISIREHSPDRVSYSSVDSGDSADYQPTTPPDLPFDAVNWKLEAAGSRTRFPMAGTYLTDTETIADSPFSRSLVDLSASPETYYHPHHDPPPSAEPVVEPVAPPPKGKMGRPKIELPGVRSKDRRRSTTSSPDIRANPDDVPLPRPRLYRQFGNLNHRLICHLQEEISQMEDDLSTLDELEAMQHSLSDSQTSPRQKLLAAKLHDFHINDLSVLYDKRNELVERLLTKTEQYNRAICAYSKSVRTLSSASIRDINDYRLAAKGQVNKVDRRVLGHEDDLVLLDSRQSHHHPNPLYSTVAAIFAAILLPLLAFGAISEFFGRIVVVAFTGAAIAFWAAHGPPGNDHPMAPQNGWAYAAGYFGFMFIAAMIIP